MEEAPPRVPLKLSPMADATATTLPEDIVTEILLLLPVICLMRFRSVCKRWYNLFCNQNFISKHHNNRIPHSNLTAMAEYGRIGELSIVFLSSDSGGEMPDIVETMLVSSLSNPDLKLQITAPVNGLFCLYNHRDTIVLWNPATREIRHIPLSPVERLPGSMTSDLFGMVTFGFDSKTNDYNIFRFVPSTRDKSSQHQVELYSLKNDSWKEISFPNHDHLRIYGDAEYSAYNNGVHYWGADTSGSVSSTFILCFHFKHEVFEKLPLPDLGVCMEKYTFPLTVINSMLSVFFKTRERSGTWIQIWVMKEHRVEESWEKQVNIHLVEEIRFPLAFWKNRVFVEDYNGKILLYDLSSHELRNLQVEDDEKSEWRVVNYAESLVPLDGKPEHGNEHIVCDRISN